MILSRVSRKVILCGYGCGAGKPAVEMGLVILSSAYSGRDHLPPPDRLYRVHRFLTESVFPFSRRLESWFGDPAQGAGAGGDGALGWGFETHLCR